MGQTEDVEKKTECNETDPTSLPHMNTKPFYKREKSSMNTERIKIDLQPEWDKQPPNVQSDNERRISIPNFVTGDFQELDEKVKSMMEKGLNLIQSGGTKAYVYKCKVCGKEGAGIAIRDHIEGHHLEGVSLPCNICEKTFRSRMILRKHKCTFT